MAACQSVPTRPAEQTVQNGLFCARVCRASPGSNDEGFVQFLRPRSGISLAAVGNRLQPTENSIGLKKPAVPSKNY